MQVELRSLSLLGLTIAIVSGACSREPPAQTVSYFREHPQELNEVMKGCHDDPGGQGRTAVCINAAEAARLRGISSLRDLPPMGLPGKDAPAKSQDADRPSPSTIP